MDKAKCSYERIVEWTIPDTRDSNGTYIDDYERTVRMHVRFVSEQIICTLDEQGQIMDNPARLPIEKDDLWTFEHPLDDAEANAWRLVKTKHMVNVKLVIQNVQKNFSC